MTERARPSGAATRSTVLAGGPDRWRRGPRCAGTAHRVRGAGPVGAGALRGGEGSGARPRVRVARPVPPGGDPPVAAVNAGGDARVRELPAKPDGPVVPERCGAARCADGGAVG